ncbi:MAG: polysaccharide biosynthesis/export family protein [Flavobacteriales bacterium]|nr:polysaccharide biosynthesis/export family protein [Flavobacteriales bacterium]
MRNPSKHYIKNKLSCISILIVLIASLSSCISTKKIVYVESKTNENTSQTYTPQKRVYKIKPGDRFYIKITDALSDISFDVLNGGASSKVGQQANVILQTPTIQDYLVNENGKIDFPLLGDIDAEGKTITELTNHVKESCKGYISNPSVKLYMTNYNITILGEVNNPSVFQLITHTPTFFDAVGLAKDLTDFADRKRVKIIRREGDNVTINYVDITEPAFISSDYYYLQPNDIVHVMPLKVKKFNRDNALPLLLSSIATILTIITISSTK